MSESSNDEFVESDSGMSDNEPDQKVPQNKKLKLKVPQEKKLNQDSDDSSNSDDDQKTKASPPPKKRKTLQDYLNEKVT